MTKSPAGVLVAIALLPSATRVDQVVVQRGVAAGDLVEVFGELAAGDQVLKRGSETLKPGAPVMTGVVH
jgi:hypothetical protein